MSVLLAFSHSHLDFRYSEWSAIVDVLDLHSLDSLPSHEHKSLLLLNTEDEWEIKEMLGRSMLLKAAYHVFYAESCHDHLINALTKAVTDGSFQNRLDIDKTWRLRFKSFGKKLSGSYSSDILKTYIDALMLDGMVVDMNDPGYDFHVIEDNEGGSTSRVFFCVQIGEGQGRLKHDFNLTERKYIGNSTMDPELAFLQANISRIQPGDFVLDPFCGTGGLLLSASKFGAISVGTEINYLIARAKGMSARMGEGQLGDDQNVFTNFEQYHLLDRFGGLVLADASEHRLWRSQTEFDVIIADPPYGIREKGRKLGKDEKKEGWLENKTEHVDQYPEKTRYRMTTLYLDLMNLAARLLVVGGRVSFWYPVLRESYAEDVLPSHGALQRIANCEQVLSRKGSRRLLCYRKTRAPHSTEKSFVERDCYSDVSYRDHIFGPPQ